MWVFAGFYARSVREIQCTNFMLKHSRKVFLGSCEYRMNVGTCSLYRSGMIVSFK